MRYRHHKHSESLELLLDTMCNTFGGIMFIALMLIIIAQMTRKAQLAIIPDGTNTAQILTTLSTQIEASRKKILALEQEIASISIPQYTQADDSIEEMTRQLNELVQQNITMNNRCKTATDTIIYKTMMNDVKSRNLHTYEDAYMKDVAKLRDQSNALMEQEKKCDSEISRLNKELENTTPRSIRFARQKNTSRYPYWIILKDNKLYRRSCHETVEKETPGTNYFQLIPIPGCGHILTDDWENELEGLLKDVNRRQNFISLVSDEHSHQIMRCLHLYLRKHGYKFFWDVHPTYSFVRVQNVQYSTLE